MKIFQYWDQPSPPADVARCIDSVRLGSPSLEHHLFSRDGARGWLARHRSARELAAFEACAVPAMQADYLRLCLLDTWGGLYVDVDHDLKEDLASLAAEVPDALLLTSLALVATGILLFPQPRHPFISASLALATDNVAERRFEDVLMSTGPAVLNAVRYAIDPNLRGLTDHVVGASPWDKGDWARLLDEAARLCAANETLVAAYRRLTVKPLAWSLRWLGPYAPTYQSTGGHWRDWTRSIYI